MIKLLLLLAALVSVFFVFSSRDQAAEIPKPGDTAPDFRLLNQNGQFKKLVGFA